MTNYEKIKAMSCEEFAKFLSTAINCCGKGSCTSNCPLVGAINCGSYGLKDRLESETEE